jgi:hypothetical protein
LFFFGHGSLFLRTTTGYAIRCRDARSGWNYSSGGHL